MFFDILFSGSSVCLFQVMFSSIIIPKNLIKAFHFILMLLEVKVGHFAFKTRDI